MECSECGQNRNYPLGVVFKCKICGKSIRYIEKPDDVKNGVTIYHKNCKSVNYIPPSAFCNKCKKLKLDQYESLITSSIRIKMNDFEAWFWKNDKIKRLFDLGLEQYDYFWVFCPICNFMWDSIMLNTAMICINRPTYFQNAERNKQYQFYIRHECPECSSDEFNIIIGEIPKSKFCENCGKEINESDINNYKTRSGNIAILCNECMHRYHRKDAPRKNQERKYREQCSEIKKIAGTNTDYIQLINEHINRIIDSSPYLSPFFDQYFNEEQVHIIANISAEKMKLTLNDKKQHIFMFTVPPICYTIWTLPLTLQKSKNWILNKYGSYSKYIEMSINVAKSGNIGTDSMDVFCHITSGLEQNRIWLQLGIWRLNKSAAIDKCILPIDFLTEEEQNILLNDDNVFQ